MYFLPDLGKIGLVLKKVLFNQIFYRCVKSLVCNSASNPILKLVTACMTGISMASYVSSLAYIRYKHIEYGCTVMAGNVWSQH